jgi:hypothetical protein
MAAAGAALGHEPGRLQREFDKRIGQRHRVIAPGELMEVPHVEALVVLSVQT